MPDRSARADLARTLADLVAQGAAIAMRHHGRQGAVMHKADDSPLTAADLEVDALLCAELARLYPDIPVVTEERAASHDAAAAGRRFFLVDPIDGTKEFVASRGEFTVNIGLVEDGRPVAGAVAAPAIGRLFAGAEGHGAWEVVEGRERALRLAAPDPAALRVVATRSHMNAETEGFLAANAARTGGLVNAGSSLKFCLLAAGEADLYPRFGPTMEWDTAAAHAVLAAAGGSVVTLEGSPLAYGKPAFRNPYFIAYTPGTSFDRPAH